MIARLEAHDKCKAKNLVHNGILISNLKMGELKKVAAQHGVSPIGSQDEMLLELVAKLAKGAAAGGGGKGGASSSEGGKVVEGKANSGDVVDLAERVLSLSEVDDHEGILNLGRTTDSPPITSKSPVAITRKAYLKLSLLLHPDKLSSKFAQATKCFQALVKAFEMLSSPDMMEEERAKGGRKGGNDDNVKTIARSNEGCYRTRVCCPRCRQPWSENTLDGNPDYFYNFMMQGLKQFNCSTCLCTFGCMTAIHKCPHCKRQYEYSPADYHRKILCGSDKCSKVLISGF
jgi:hypothetical protein